MRKQEKNQCKENQIDTKECYRKENKKMEMNKKKRKEWANENERQRGKNETPSGVR